MRLAEATSYLYRYIQYMGKIELVEVEADVNGVYAELYDSENQSTFRLRFEEASINEVRKLIIRVNQRAVDGFASSLRLSSQG